MAYYAPDTSKAGKKKEEEEKKERKSFAPVTLGSVQTESENKKTFAPITVGNAQILTEYYKQVDSKNAASARNATWIPNTNTAALNQNLEDQGLVPIFSPNTAYKPVTNDDIYERIVKNYNKKKTEVENEGRPFSSTQYNTHKNTVLSYKSMIDNGAKLTESQLNAYRDAQSAVTEYETWEKRKQAQIEQINLDIQKAKERIKIVGGMTDEEADLFAIMAESDDAENVATTTEAANAFAAAFSGDSNNAGLQPTTVSRAAAASAGTKKDEARQKLLSMGFTDEQIDEYLLAYKNVRNDMIAAQRQLQTDRESRKHPILSSLGSIPVGLVGGVTGVLGSILEPGVRNDPTFTAFNNYSSTVQSSVRDEIESAVRKTGASEFWVKAAGYGYSGAMSAVQSAAAMGIGSAIGAPFLGEMLLGAGAASQAYNEALINGHSYGDALLTGTIAGLIETLTEHLSLENLRALKATAGLKNLPLNLVKSFITEGSEEIASDVLNEAWDYFAHGGLSEYEKFVSDYLDTHRGATEAEARQAYASQFGMQILESGIVGGISGLLGTGWTTTANGPRNYIANTRTGADYQAAYQQLLKQKNEGADVNPNSLYGNLLNLTADLPTDSRAVQNAANAKNLFTQEDVTRKEMRRQGAIINDVVNEAAESEPKSVIQKLFNVNRWIEEEPSKAQQYRIDLNKQANEARLMNAMFFNDQKNADKEKEIKSVTGRNADKAMFKTLGLDADTVKDSVDKKNGVVPSRVESISKDGTVTLAMSDGTTVQLSDAKFATRDLAVLYQGAAKIAAKQGYDAQTTNNMINAVDLNSDVPVSTQLVGLDLSIRYGRAGITAPNDATALVLSDAQRKLAYGYGQKLTSAEVAARQETLSSAYEAMQAPKEQTVEWNGKTEKITTVGGVSWDSLSSRQKAAVRLINKLVHNITKNNVVFFESVWNEENKRYEYATDVAGYKAGDAASNGITDRKTGTVYLDLNSVNEKGEEVLLYAAAHEFTHFMQDYAPTKYREMADFLTKEYGNRTTEALIRAKMDEYKKAGQPLTEKEALDEVVADAMQQMLTDGNALEKMARLKAQSPELAEKIRAFFRRLGELMGIIRKEYEGLDPYSREAQLLRRMADTFERLSEMYSEGLVEAGQNFEAMSAEQQTMVQQTGEFNEDGEKTSHSHSLKSYAVSTGYDIAEVDGLWQVVDQDGNVVKKVSEDVVRNSPLGNMVDIAVRNGNLKASDAKKQYAMLTKLLQMCVDYKDFTLPWEISGSLLFSAIKNNSDAQYGRTIDFSTICKKTQSIINVMSRTMMKLGRGLTAKEVREIVYKEVGKAGEPTPCPVCYVFSRWMGVGSIIQNIYDFQMKYNNASRETVETVCSRVEAQVRAFADKKNKSDYFDENGGYKYGKIIADMKTGPNNRIKNAEKNINAHYAALDTIAYVSDRLAKAGLSDAKRAEYEKTLKEAKKKVLSDAKFAAAQTKIDNARKELAPLEEYQFLHATRFNSEDNGYVYDETYQPVKSADDLKSVLFDLTAAEELATRYPKLWKYRSTRGCNAGKAILPYSDMWTGEIIQGIAHDIKEIKRGDDNMFQNGDEAAQRTETEKAIKKAAAQNLIGGMRFQSTSDFRYEYGSDYLMAFLELQAIGSNVQLYTKVIEAVDLFASMGADINLSLMPENDGFLVDENGNRIKDADGNDILAFSPVTGINAEGAFQLISKYDNVQAILVGISDEHIIAALKDGRIGFVIPFHGSGNTVKVIQGLMELLQQNLDITKARDYSAVQNDRERAKKTYGSNTALYERHKDLRALRMKILTGMEGQKKATFTAADIDLIRSNPYLSDLYTRFWEDETNAGEYGVRLSKSQAEKIFPFEYWDKSLTLDEADENGRRFVEYCESLGIYPRFSGVIDEKGTKGGYGDFTEIPGYWKLLIDRPMYDALNGDYREQQKINATSMDTNFLLPSWGTDNYGRYMQKDSTKDMAKVEEIADRVVAKLSHSVKPGRLNATRNDINTLQAMFPIPKNVNDFSQKEIDATEKWAKRYYELMETKSPFFKAWFGDWRAYDIKNFAEVVSFSSGEKVKTNKSTRTVFNKDSRFNIRVDTDLFGDSNHYASVFGDKKQTERLLSKIDDIIKSAILLYTETSDADKGDNKKGNTEFMHSFYSIISVNGAPFLAKLIVEEYDVDGKTRAYNLRQIKMSTLQRAQFGQILTKNRGDFALQVDALTVAQLYGFVKTYDINFKPGRKVSPLMLNDDGTPKVLYHGTTSDFSVFKKGDLGFHVGSEEQAIDRVKDESNARIMPLYASLQNPLEIGMDYGDWNALNVAEMMLETEVFEDRPDVQAQLRKIIDIDGGKESKAADLRRNAMLRKLLQSLGYDGIAYENTFEGNRYTGDNTSYIVFQSSQLKSAETKTAKANVGTFSKYNANISHSIKPDTDPLDSRTLLSTALMSAAQNDIERKTLEKYQSEIETLNQMQADLNAKRREIKELSFAKGKRDTERLKALRLEAAKLANNVNTKDKQLLRMEASKALENVLAFETQKAVARERERARATMSAEQAAAREDLQRKVAEAKTAVRDSERAKANARVEKKVQEALAAERKRSLKLEMDMIRAAGEDYNRLQRQKELSDRKIERLEADIEHRKDMRQRGIDQRKSTDAKVKIRKIRDDLIKRLKSGNDRTHIPAAVAQEIIDICVAIDPTGVNQDSQAAQKYRDGCEALLRLRSAYDAIETDADSGFSESFRTEFSKAINELAQALKDTPLREMNRDQLEALADVLAQIRHTIVNANKLLGAEKAYEVATAKQNIRDNMSEVKEKKLTHGKILNWSMRWFENPLRAVKEITGFDANAVLRKLIDDVAAGKRKAAMWAMKATKRLEKLATGKENQKLYRDAAQKAYDFGLKDIDGNDLKLSKMQAMTLILLYERETQNDDHRHLSTFCYITDIDELRKGNWQKARENAQIMPVLTKEAIAKLQAGLNTEWDQAYMAAARDIFNKMSNEALNEVSMQLIGRPIATEKAYIPYEVNDDFLAKIDENVAYDRSILNAGFTKALKKNAPQPLVIRGLNDILEKHIKDVANYYGTAIPVYNWNKVFGSGERTQTPVREAVRNTWNDKTVRFLSQAVADAQGARSGDTVPVFQMVKSNWVQATLAFNLSVWMKQAASFPTAGAVLHGRSLAAALPYFAKSLSAKQRQRIYDEADKWTAALYTRRTGMESTQEIAEFSKQKGRVKQISDSLGHLSPMNWIQSMDVRTVSALWIACKSEIKRTTELKYGSDAYYKAVAELFEKVVENTQPMYDPLYRAEIAKNKVAQNLIVFQTQPIQNSGILREAFMERRVMAKKYGVKSAQSKAATRKFARACTSQLVSHMFFAAMTALSAGLLHRLDPWRDDEDKELTWESVLEKYGLDVLNSTVSAIFPVIGNYMFSIFENVFNGTKYDVVSDPVVDQINSIISSLQNLQNPSYKTVSTAITTVLSLFGVPAANAQRIGEGIYHHVRDILNDQFLSFESGVKRNATQDKYRLYEAIVAGNYKVIDEYRDEKGDEWSSYIQTVLKEYDERIVLAAVALNDNDTGAYEQYMADIYRDVSMSLNPAYTSDDVTEAVRSMVNTLRNGIKDLAQAKADGKTDDYDEKLQSLIEDGFDADYIEQLVDAYELDEDETEEEAPSLYKAADINNAFAKGDLDKVRSMAPGFKTKDAYDGAVKSAMRKYDPRIKEAAQARFDGDTSEYIRIVDDIVDDGYFSQELVVEAIKAETGTIGKEPKETDPLWYLDEENFSGGEGDYDIKAEDAKRVLATGNAQDIKLVYDSFVQDAIAKGNVREDAVKSAQSSFRTAIKNMFIDGDISMSQVTNYLKQYGGQTDENDIYWTEREWQYNKDNKNNPDAPSYKKYTTFYKAVQSGVNLKSVISEYTTHGVTAETMAGQITSYFKPIYKSMNNTERAALKGYLLNAYVALGYNRTKKSKDIDKWLTQ